jgi:hypothetical protein
MRILQVLPETLGWKLSGLGEPMYFRSGGHAEATARRLAQAAAETGEHVELHVFDRRGALAGQLRFSAAD